MKRSNAAKNSECPVKKRKVKTSDHDCEVVAVDRHDMNGEKLQVLPGK